MRTVLIADDNPGMRALLEATLAGDPRMDIMEAKDGTEALDLARRYLPDILPGLTGFEVCRQLKRRWDTKDIIILIVSALTQDDHKREAGAAGADGFFAKPFSPLALLNRLEPLLLDASPAPVAARRTC